jgi:hypothetical protein
MRNESATEAMRAAATASMLPAAAATMLPTATAAALCIGGNSTQQRKGEKSDYCFHTSTLNTGGRSVARHEPGIPVTVCEADLKERAGLEAPKIHGLWQTGRAASLRGVYFRTALAVNVILATRSSAACRCFIATCSTTRTKG